MCNEFRPLRNNGLCPVIPICSAGAEGWGDRTNNDAQSWFQHQSGHSMTFSLLNSNSLRLIILFFMSAQPGLKAGVIERLEMLLLTC